MASVIDYRGDGYYDVVFQYDPSAISAIKDIPGRQWSAPGKIWRVPVSQGKALLAFTKEHHIAWSERAAEEYKRHSNLEKSAEAIKRGEGLLPIEHAKTTPWLHQQKAYTYVQTREAALLHMGMGTGKTKVIIDTIANDDSLVHTLIICPLSVIPVWEYQFSIHCPDDRMPLICSLRSSSTVATRAKLLQEALTTGERVVVLVNYEAIIREPLKKTLLAYKFDMVVLDEGQRIKAPGGKQSKVCARLRDRAKKRVILSGTPMPHSPLDVYALYRFLDPGVFGTSFTRFRGEYAHMGGYGNYQVLGYKNLDALEDKINSRRIHITRDVLTLPEAVHSTIPIFLPADVYETYMAIDSEFVAKVKTGTITVSNALTELLRLQQITSGHITTDDGVIEALHNAKGEALEDILLSIDPGDSVVVFARFVEDLNRIRTTAEKAERSYSELSGRAKQLDTWKASTGGVVGVQINAGAEGIDLTHAHHCVFFSLGFSLGQYEQALARVHRPGQEETVNYYHLVTRQTVDEKVYAALRERKHVVDMILDQAKND